MPRPLNNRLYDVDQWLDRNEVVQRDNRVLIGIALLFLGVCLVNVVGLLLAKFLNAAPLTGLRRALGASRRDIVRQHLTEVLLLGLAGGVLGLVLAVGGLAGIRALYDSDFTSASYERLTAIDPLVVLRHARAVARGGRHRGPLPLVAHRPYRAGRCTSRRSDSRTPDTMDIRPILSSLRRSPTGAILVALQIALALAIVVNSLYIIVQRIETREPRPWHRRGQHLLRRLGAVQRQVPGRGDDARGPDDPAQPAGRAWQPRPSTRCRCPAAARRRRCTPSPARRASAAT